MSTNDAKKFFTLDDIATADGTRYDSVDAHGGTWRIGTLSSADVLDFVERRKDPNGRFEASMFLVARSLVFGDPAVEDHITRVPDEMVPAVIVQFKAKDDDENGKLVRACLKLNGMLKEDPAAPTDTDRGNVSGEVTSDASPIDSLLL